MMLTSMSEESIPKWEVSKHAGNWGGGGFYMTAWHRFHFIGGGLLRRPKVVSNRSKSGDRPRSGDQTPVREILTRKTCSIVRAFTVKWDHSMSQSTAITDSSENQNDKIWCGVSRHPAGDYWRRFLPQNRWSSSQFETVMSDFEGMIMERRGQIWLIHKVFASGFVWRRKDFRKWRPNWTRRRVLNIILTIMSRSLGACREEEWRIGWRIWIIAIISQNKQSLEFWTTMSSRVSGIFGRRRLRKRWVEKFKTFYSHFSFRG